jgi:signal transduction histidine kinase
MIKAYTEMMRDIEGENTPENMQVVIDETERLCELVNDILAISRHQAGVQAMEYSDFDLSQTLSQTVERYRRLKGADGFEFDLDIDGCAFVHADRSAILQVVSNLINNALNYANGKKIEISCKVSDTCVRVQVKDTGEGIPERELANIWDRYYKLDKTHARSRAGSGLGLSIVRQILEAHRARYGVESTIGVGTCFWFELPLEKGKQNFTE